MTDKKPAEIEIQLLSFEDRKQLMATLGDAHEDGELSSTELMIVRYEATLRAQEEHIKSVAQLTHSTAKIARTGLRNLMLATENFVPEKDRGDMEAIPLVNDFEDTEQDRAKTEEIDQK